MYKNIENKIGYLQSKKEEIESLKENLKEKRTDFDKKIEEARNKFEKSLEPLKINLDVALNDFNLEKEKVIYLRLLDIVEELCSLTGTSEDKIGINIKTSLGYWGKNSLKDLVEMKDYHDQSLSCTGNYTNDKVWHLTIYADKNMKSNDLKQEFCYEFTFDLDLNELQFDNKPLLDHCKAQVYYDDMQGLYFTNLLINKDIDYLKCNIKLNDLVIDDIKQQGYVKFYPANLFRQAAVNVALQYQNKIMENKKYQKKITR